MVSCDNKNNNLINNTMTKEIEFLETIGTLVWNDISKQELVEMLEERKKALEQQLTIPVVGCSLPTSTQLIEDCKKRFEELKENYSFDWRSFYNGYLESFGKYAVKHKK